MVRNCTELIHYVGTSDSDSLVACSAQKRLDRILKQKQKIAAQIKHEQKEMQEFSVLMKSVSQHNAHQTMRLQDKLAQVQISSSVAKEHSTNFIVPNSTASH